MQLSHHGLLRPLGAPELSDGTLRELLWIAALLSPRPAQLGQTAVAGRGPIDQPAWHWPKR